MRTILLISILTLGLNISAAPAGPQTEPGPVIALGDAATEAVAALMYAKSEDLQNFSKSGNTVKSVSVQNVSPDVTRYTFVRQNCMKGGVAGGMCLGGARLTVILKEVRQGSMVKIEAQSSVLLIK